MPRNLQNWLTFSLERLIQRGAFFQLLVMAGLVVLVATLGGVMGWLLTDGFGGVGEAIWWAFLRLTDPGYLGDDEGLALRIISTTVTVLGYVIFMGSLIAILTQWLGQTMRRLESGLTPIALEDHILILGWTNRTPAIVRELMQSEGRMRRFLQRRGARRVRIVILADEVTADLRAELRESVGPAWHERQVIFRSGSSLRIEHLRRVDFDRAAVVILPGADFTLGGSTANDTRIVKTLLSISNRNEGDAPPPPVVAELFDAQKVPIAMRAHRGELHLIAGDGFISRLIAQTVRHRGLSFVYGEVLTHSTGNEVYIRAWPALTGTDFHTLGELFPAATPLGVVRSTPAGDVPLLNPAPGLILEDDDRLVLLAQRYEDAAPVPGGTPGPPLPVPSEARIHAEPRRRLLVLGWSHKVTALVNEFGSYAGEHFEIDLLSVLPIEERAEALRHINSDRVAIRQLEGDFTVAADLRAVSPAGYDHIILLGSDWLESGEEADARTLLGYVLLRSLLDDQETAEETATEVLIELMDPENARLFRRRPGEVIISPVVLSHLLAHVALRRELRLVFEELFGPGGAEIIFRPVEVLGLSGTSTDRGGIRRAAAAWGETAIGVRLASKAGQPHGGIHLNPGIQARWTFGPGDEVIVLSTYDAEE